MISLRNAKERRSDTLWHLANRGLYPEIFDAYDASKTELTAFNFFCYDRGPSSTYRIGAKTTCIYASHYALWNVCSHLPEDIFVILEDDVRLHPAWKQKLESVLTSLPSDWDLLFPGSCCTLNEGFYEEIKRPLYSVKHVLCFHCYAIRAKALPFILEQLEPFDGPVDIAFCLKVVPKLKTFAIHPNIARQCGTIYPA